MKYRVLFSKEDIARFYYNKNIKIKDRIRISKQIYDSKELYIDKHKYKDIKHFIREVEETLNKMVYKRELKIENFQIEIIQSELSLNKDIFKDYTLKTSSGEQYLKQIRLNLDFNSSRNFAYMKLRTLINEFGYKRRNLKLIEILNKSLDQLDLYIAINEERLLDNKELINKKLDSNIRIYSEF